MSNWTNKDLGPIDAYALAVAGGYTGTKQQWINEIANASTNAQTASTKASAAADSAAAAILAKEAAQDAAETASAAYNVNLLAENFDVTALYPAGQFVIYDGGLYLLPEGHTAGTTWANTEKIACDIGTQVTEAYNEIVKRPKAAESDAEDVDLDVTDEDGNVIVRFAAGHIKTKRFDSSDLGEAVSVKGTNAAGVDLDVTDEEGNVLARLTDGNIVTKNFDSRDCTEESGARSTPLFSTVDWWEPETADSGYSNPTADWGGDTYRADWTASDKYYYYDFLAHYYDTYLGTRTDGYRVTKRSLGQDSANTGHELFEYDFCPLNYRYTILLSAGMNADETQGIWGMATFMRAIMNKEETNMEIAYNNIRFKVIPIINASGFDKAHLRYTYSDNVNPNFNFNYKDSWSNQTAPTSEKGAYPDSNVSSRILKNWLNENAWRADLWVDLHTGRWPNSYPGKKIFDVRVADSSMVTPFADYVTLAKAYYQEKGYIESTDDIGGANSIRNNLDYQKTVYAFDVCGIKAIMPEMHLESVAYGSDGLTNNSVNGIKCYAAQLRAMMMCYINESASASPVKLDKIEFMKLHDKRL